MTRREALPKLAAFHMDPERTDKWCERAILGLVLAILVYGPLATGAVLYADLLVLQALTVLVLVVWCVRLWVNPRHRLLWPPVCWAVLAFVGWAILQHHQAPVEFIARRELIRILIYAAVFFAALNNLNRQESVQIICYTLIGLGVFLSAWGVYQFATGSEKVWAYVRPPGYQGRGSGSYINPNHLAGYLEMVGPMAFLFAFAGRMKPVGRVVLGYAALVILVGIGVTMSRGGWLASGVVLLALLVWLLGRRQYRLPLLVAACLLVIGGGYILSRAQIAKKRVERALTQDISNSDVLGRFSIWKPAWQMVRDHPWTGVGPGHFDASYGPYRSWVVQQRPAYAHNDYLNALADWGVAGAALIAACWGLFFWGVARTWKFVRRSEGDLGLRTSNRAAFVLGGTLGLLAILAHAVTDFNLQIPANAIVAVTLMALVSGYIRYATDDFWWRPRLPGRLVVSVALLCAAGYLGSQGLTRARELAWLRAAERETLHTPARFTALERAAALQPMNWQTAYDLGEAYRQVSWMGESDYATSAEKALVWFQRARELNPLNAYVPLRIGMCLDWLKRPGEAAPWFDKAVELEPQHHEILALVGWHHFHNGDLPNAKRWLERSLEMEYAKFNPIATNYLGRVNLALAEQSRTNAPARVRP